MNDETIIPIPTPQPPVSGGLPEVVSNIADEDQFQDAITAEKQKSQKSDGHIRFETLATEIHAALSRQDSDAALTLITK